MNKICGYTCKHSKGGVCQITGCDKKIIMTSTTEPQTIQEYGNKFGDEDVIKIYEEKLIKANVLKKVGETK